MAEPACTRSTGDATAAMPAHPLARAVMRVLTHRDDADLRFVFAAVARRVRPEGDGRRESALVALERCATELGVTEPTMRKYAAWRENSDAQRGAPSVQQIRTLFDGSWGRAVQAMPQVPGSDPLVRRLAAKGPKFTDAECCNALNRWHAETGDFTAMSYKAWARRTREAEGTVRIPASCDPIRDRFGSWVAALDTAGIERGPRGPRCGRPQRVRGATRDEVAAGLRTAYEDLREPFTQTRYDAWVARKAGAHGGSDAPFRLVSGGTVCEMFDRWSNAVAEVLGHRRDAAVALRQRKIRFSETDLARAWWACHRTLGEPPSLSHYVRWRNAEAERTGFEVWPPSSSSISQRLGNGSWRRASERLQAQGPSDE